MNIFQEFVKNVRNLRAEAGIHPQKAVPEAVVFLSEGNHDLKVLIIDNADLFSLLAKVGTIRVAGEETEKPSKSLMTVTEFGEVFLIVGELLDADSEIARLTAELAKAESEMNRCIRKLDDSAFISKAPEDIVEKERIRLSQYKEKIVLINRNLESLSR
jgi:valyl-tRNA synthetase